MGVSYYFVGFNQPEQLKVFFVSREKIYLASSKTDFRLVDVSENFYDTDAEKQKCLGIPDDSFDLYVKLCFARQGYKFVKKQDE